jgi:hypothetical protein
MKRTTNNVSYYTRSNKKPRLSETSPAEIMVSASHLHNFMINDCLVDWLKFRGRSGTRYSPAYSQQTGFNEFIMNRGVEFETELIKYIDSNVIPVVSVSDYITDESCAKTIELMHMGTPIIHSAPVKNMKTHTQGVIDLLVRSDYLCQLINEPPLLKNEVDVRSPILNKNYHYVVIDIKFSTLPLRSDGIHLLNSGHYLAYKAQTYIYNEAVGRIQGYTPPYTFIMGRRWRYIKKDIKHKNHTCLDRLGKISFNEIDSDIPLKVREGVDWVRNVKLNGQKWSVTPPSRKELYPNMCIDSGIWNMEKERIANSIDEITNIWYLGTKHRNKGLLKNIKSWRDKRCTTKNLDFGGTRSHIVDKIMSINRQKIDTIRPNIITGDTADWRDSSNEIFVDFETLSDIFSDFKDLPNQKSTDMIFMIGVGWEEKGKWKYTNYICNEATKQEEYRIMDEFMKLIRRRGNPKIRYWYAESNFWKTSESKQFDSVNSFEKTHISKYWKLNNKWTDLYNLFQKEPIVLKGCFKFGLKSIARAMREHGMIKTSIESICDSGMAAMINAAKCYKQSSNPANSEIMLDIAKYNEFDCKVLWEIINYLRKNHQS